jgi:hypothetical protein
MKLTAGFEELLKNYIKNISELKALCKKCLSCQRWNGNVVLIILDAAFTSVGVNYFQVVLPKVKAFEVEFVKTNKVTSLLSLAQFDYKSAFHIWKNSRSWDVAQKIAKYLSQLSDDDKKSLKLWAESSSFENWKNDPIGKINGVGFITYQYLRMMGGIDTVMPDKIVKRVINEILIKANEMPIYNDMEFIKKVETLAKTTGYRPIELCFMTWFVNNPERISDMP